jgi:hypothetical protein
MLRRGDLDLVIWFRGTPTIMVGEIEDPHFEEHLKEGPYVVFDDAALPRYKNDPRVHFVPGHPVLRDAMPQLMKGLGVSAPGRVVQTLQQWRRREMHNLEYGNARRKAMAVATPLAMVGGLAAAIAGAMVLAEKLSPDRPPSARRRVGRAADRFLSRFGG